MNTEVQEPEVRKSWPVALGLGAVSFLLYFVTGLEYSAMPELADFPLGADTPWYVDLFRDPAEINSTLYSKHPLSIFLARAMSIVLAPLGNPVVQANLWIALAGALNLVLAWKLFESLIETKLSLWATAIYGLSGAVWFFSSFPESYGITTLLGSSYLLLFVRDDGSWGNAAARSAVLVLGTLNEVIFPMILVVPFLWHGLELLRDRELLMREAVSVAAAGAASVGILLVTVPDFPAMYIYRAEALVEGEATLPTSTLYAFAFFGVGFPATVADAIHPLIPSYAGLFEGSLAPYLERPGGIAFLLLHCLVLGAVIWTARDNARWVLPLGVYVLSRAVVAHLFNAPEAVLYAAPTVLPLVIILVLGVHKAAGERSQWALAAYLVAILAANWGFYQPYVLG